MTYQEFLKITLQAISTKLGSGYQVSLQDIIKNNDTHLDGLTILTDQSNISPTIYLNYYYEKYLKGMSLSSIFEDILQTYYKNVPKDNIDISFFTDYTKVKDRIVFKLINYERNKELLSKVPHVRYLDLAVVFNCLLDNTLNGYATILIYRHHLSYWNISEEDLFTLAMENTPVLLRYHLENMADILNDLIPEDTEEFSEEEFMPVPMYVLSNSSKLNGSTCILYQNLLEKIAKKLKSDFYILPSSVHEVLLIPAEHASSYAELSSMVKEVNATQLSREEILSDHVYYYSQSTGRITM